MKQRFVSILVFVTVLAVNIFGQREPTEVMERPFAEAEKRDALRVARAFSERLQRTQDIGPLLDDFMSANFIENAMRDHFFNVFVFQDEKLIRTVPIDQQRRYFVEGTNFLFLTVLYQLALGKADSDGDLEYPPEVRPIVDKYFKAKDSPQRSLRSLKDISSATSDFSSVNRALRPYLQRFRSMSPADLLDSIKGETEFGELYRVEISKCKDKLECRELPIDSRVFGISVPLGFVEIGEINRKMKIIGLFQFDSY